MPGLLRAVQANGGKVEGLDIVAAALPPWFGSRHDPLAGAARASAPGARFRHWWSTNMGRCAASVTLEDILEESSAI